MDSGIDVTADWGDKLAELVKEPVKTPLPPENAVNAQLTGIDGAGFATLVSKLKNKAAKTYDGFAFVFYPLTVQPAKDPQSFEWLQFITRQLVVGSTALKGNLVLKTNTVACQLVESTVEITDYTFASGSQPANWNTCWKVDSGARPTPRPFYRQQFQYAMSAGSKITAILDDPSPLVGAKVMENNPEYVDAPANCVVMKELLGSNKGTSRAYFSDYLVKKDGEKWRIVARFDFNLTWDPVTKDSKKDNTKFTLHSLKTTQTTKLLECHNASLLHIITNTIQGTNQPWKKFHDSELVQS